MEFPFYQILTDEEETSKVAESFSKILKTGEIVCLNGNLGSGKTFFVKKICDCLGIDTASSPSFSIVNEYSGKIKIVHLDFYRLKKIEELYDIGFDEYLSSGESIVFIEWAEMFPDVLPNSFYNVQIKIIDDQKREIKITKHG